MQETRFLALASLRKSRYITQPGLPGRAKNAEISVVIMQDIALILAVLVLLLVRLCHKFSEPVSLGFYLLPALAIVCTAVSLGPAHSTEIGTGLALEYETVNGDSTPLAASSVIAASPRRLD